MKHDSMLSLAYAVLLMSVPGLSGVGAQQATGSGEAGQAQITLDAVLAAASAEHPLVAAARARVDAAIGSRRTAGAVPNPVATYQVENVGFPGSRAPAGIDRETASFLTIPLEPIYQRGPRVRQADEEVKASRAVEVGVQRQVSLDAARAFFRLALAQVSVETAMEALAGLDRLTSYNRARVTEGVSAEGDLVRVQLERDRAAAEVVMEQAELARARAQLQPYLRSDRATRADSLRVSLAGLRSTFVLPTLPELLQQASRTRPELLIARARVAAAGAETGVQQTLTVRQVGATFGSKRVSGENSMIAGVSVPLPIFDRNRGEVQRARSSKTAAELELAWSQRTVSSEVEGALEAARLLSAEVARLDSSFLEKADESRRIALAAYEGGIATLLQVLDASRARSESRLTYFRTLFAQRQSLLELLVASGSDPVFEPGRIKISDVTAPTTARKTGEIQ
ncbi:MAG: TolC family protein [Gemmatimonadales bacterium]